MHQRDVRDAALNLWREEASASGDKEDIEVLGRGGVRVFGTVGAPEVEGARDVVFGVRERDCRGLERRPMIARSGWSVQESIFDVSKGPRASNAGQPGKTTRPILI